MEALEYRIPLTMSLEETIAKTLGVIRMIWPESLILWEKPKEGDRPRVFVYKDATSKQKGADATANFITLVPYSQDLTLVYELTYATAAILEGLKQKVVTTPCQERILEYPSRP